MLKTGCCLIEVTANTGLTVFRLQAILMSMCLQGMVAELIMKKQGQKIKKVSGTLCLYSAKFESANENIGYIGKSQ